MLKRSRSPSPSALHPLHPCKAPNSPVNTRPRRHISYKHLPLPCPAHPSTRPAASRAKSPGQVKGPQGPPKKLMHPKGHEIYNCCCRRGSSKGKKHGKLRQPEIKSAIPRPVPGVKRHKPGGRLTRTCYTRGAEGVSLFFCLCLFCRALRARHPPASKSTSASTAHISRHNPSGSIEASPISPISGAAAAPKI